MSLHAPVTQHFVNELVQRMRGAGTATPADRECEHAWADDDCSDVEFAAPTPNGAGPLMASLLPAPQ